MNRRRFLQGMMGLAGASVAAKFAHLEIPGREPEPQVEAIPDEVLDAPVTPDNPLCWVELDGVRYGLADAQIDARQEYESFLEWGKSTWVQHIPTMRSFTIACRSYQDTPQLIDAAMAGQRMDCVVALSPYRRFGCAVHLTEYAVNVTPDRQVVCDFTLQGVGELRTL